MTGLVEGPAWSAPGSGRYAGRYPLAVERHTLAQVDRLLPGVTTVTPHGRYYALHGFLASETERRSLSDAEAQDLLRRVEVVIAAISTAHEHAPPHAGLNRAHGADAITEGVHAGSVDVVRAAGFGPGRYAKAPWGYWGPYRGAEVMLGILDTDRVRPGEKFDRSQVAPALAGLLDLAARRSLDRGTLDASADLCVCGGMSAPDGLWLARTLAPRGVESSRTRAGTRLSTIRMFTRALDLVEVTSFTRDISALIAFGPLSEDDPVLRSLNVTAGWRGTVLRAESVAAWRSLWAWLVRQVVGLTSRQTLGEALAAEMPEETVGAFVDGLPPIRAPEGFLAPAEREPALASLSRPLRSIAVLAIGAARVKDLEGATLVGFQGRTPEEIGQELGPSWLASQLETWRSRPMQDFARHLTGLLINRAERIAFRKATRDRQSGMLKVPTRVYLRDEWVFKDSDESSGSVSLRWDQLGTVLAETGVVARVGDAWRVTDRGRDVIG